MEKIQFFSEDTGEGTWFFVLEETRVNGVDYILVTDDDDPEADAEAMILKDTSNDGDSEALFEPVEDERELRDVMKIFTELLDDTDIVM